MARDFPRAPPGGLALVATGAVDVPAGRHTLCTNSDGGSWLYLDGALLVDNPKPSNQTQVCQTAALAGGAHAVRALSLERGGGGAVLEVTLDQR